MRPLEPVTGGVRIRLHIQPRASRTEVVGVYGDALKIRIAAPPVDGAANVELVRFLAETLAVPSRQVEVVSGQTSRIKTAVIAGVTEAVAKHIVEINPTLSLQQVVDPKFELSLLPGPGNTGAAGMIQQVGDFLLTQDIIKAKIDGKSAVDGSWVAEYLKAKR